MKNQMVRRIGVAIGLSAVASAILYMADVISRDNMVFVFLSTFVVALLSAHVSTGRLGKDGIPGQGASRNGSLFK